MGAQARCNNNKVNCHLKKVKKSNVDGVEAVFIRENVKSFKRNGSQNFFHVIIIHFERRQKFKKLLSFN